MKRLLTLASIVALGSTLAAYQAPAQTPAPTSTPDDDDNDRPIPIHTDLVTVTIGDHRWQYG